MLIHEIIAQVRNLNPGQEIGVSYSVLDKCTSILGPEFDIIDRILSGILGSSYEYMIIDDAPRNIIIFRRLKRPVSGYLRASVSSDRRHYFYRLPNWMWKLKSEALILQLQK